MNRQQLSSAFAKGWKQAKQGLWSDALACFEQATCQSQIPSWVLCDRAITQEHLHNLHEAIQTYQVCMQKTTLNAFAAFRLGTLFAKTQQFQEARFHLEKAIQLKPDYAEAYHNLGWVLLNARNAEGEIDNTRELLFAYRRAVELYTQQYRQDLVQTIKQAFQIAGVELSTRHSKKGSEIEEDIFVGLHKKLEMQGRSSSIRVEMTGEQQDILHSWLRKSTTPMGLAKRARAILMLAEGKTFSKTSQDVGIGERHIRKWARRFVEQGIEGLYDGKRPGRPPVFSPSSCVVSG